MHPATHFAGQVSLRKSTIIFFLNSSFVTMYFLLPETENCSLEDIERHFSDNSKKLTDIDIHRNAIEVEKNRLP